MTKTTKHKIILGCTIVLTLLLTNQTVYAFTTERDILYTSTLDNLTLKIDVSYDENATNQPVILILGGHNGTFSGTDIPERFAQYGLFAAKVYKRGFNGSQGVSDDSGREVYDIIDASEYIKENFSEFIDEENINVVGYSGGGGNVFGLITKFPDYFNTAISFFGISDYASWYNFNTGANRGETIQTRVGSIPEEVLDNYSARAHYLGASNNPYTNIQLFHDAQDAIVPIEQSYLFRGSGLDNIVMNVSNEGDAIRWIHGYPENGTDLVIAEKMFIPGIVQGIRKKTELAEFGTLFVPGYVKTKDFFIILGDGTNEAGNLEYDIDGTFKITTVTGDAEFLFKRYNLEPDSEYIVNNTVIQTDSSGTLTISGIVPNFYIIGPIEMPKPNGPSSRPELIPTHELSDNDFIGLMKIARNIIVSFITTLLEPIRFNFNI